MYQTITDLCQLTLQIGMLVERNKLFSIYYIIITIFCRLFKEIIPASIRSAVFLLRGLALIFEISFCYSQIDKLNNYFRKNN